VFIFAVVRHPVFSGHQGLIGSSSSSALNKIDAHSGMCSRQVDLLLSWFGLRHALFFTTACFLPCFFVLQSFNLPSSLASQKDAPSESLSRLALRYDTFIFFPEIFVSFGSSSGDRGGEGGWPAGGEDAPRHTAIAAAHCFAVSYL
jgi:hypothetical protein